MNLQLNQRQKAVIAVALAVIALLLLALPWHRTYRTSYVGHQFVVSLPAYARTIDGNILLMEVGAVVILAGAFYHLNRR